MATKEQLEAAINTVRGHRAKILERAEILERLANELEILTGEESFAGEYSAGTAAIIPPTTQPSPEKQNETLQIEKGMFFGKTLGQAAIALLRFSPRPMTMKAMVIALEAADFPFDSKDHYFSLYRTLRPDRIPPEIVKHGKLYGLRQRISKSGTTEPDRQVPNSDDE
jgi:hypothetical protein